MIPRIRRCGQLTQLPGTPLLYNIECPIYTPSLFFDCIEMPTDRKEMTENIGDLMYIR